MTKEIIISFLRTKPKSRLDFETPIKVKLTPHDQAMTINGIYMKEERILITHEDGLTDWDYADEPVKGSIIQRIKLINISAE
jgi:hypothetical protein